MKFEVEHYMIYSLSPIIGLFFSYISSKKILKLTFIGSILALIPILTGYEFLFDAYYECIFTILLSFGFILLINGISPKWRRTALSIIICLGIFLPTAYYSLMENFFTTDDKLEQTKIDDYQIDYRVVSGFSGRPAYYYQLTHKPFWGIFYKKFENDGTKINDCTIEFKIDGKNQQFNICQ